MGRVDSGFVLDKEPTDFLKTLHNNYSAMVVTGVLEYLEVNMLRFTRIQLQTIWGF